VADGLREELKAHTGEVTSGLREDLKGYTDAAVEEVKRHFDVVAEDLRARDRLLAEAIASVAERVDRLGADLRAEMAAQDSETRTLLTLSHRGLDTRLRAVEARLPA
jgi:hypothetical protein